MVLMCRVECSAGRPAGGLIHSVRQVGGTVGI